MERDNLENPGCSWLRAPVTIQKDILIQDPHPKVYSVGRRLLLQINKSRRTPAKQVQEDIVEPIESILEWCTWGTH